MEEINQAFKRSCDLVVTLRHSMRSHLLTTEVWRRSRWMVAECLGIAL